MTIVGWMFWGLCDVVGLHQYPLDGSCDFADLKTTCVKEYCAKPQCTNVFCQKSSCILDLHLHCCVGHLYGFWTVFGLYEVFCNTVFRHLFLTIYHKTIFSAILFELNRCRHLCNFLVTSKKPFSSQSPFQAAC